MTDKQRRKRVAVTAVRVHPFFYHTVYGPKQRLEHFLNQLSRVVAMLFFVGCFFRIALWAPFIPFYIHIPSLAVLLAATIFYGNKINRSAAGRAKFRKFEKIKKSSVIYTRNKKARCANDNG